MCAIRDDREYIKQEDLTKSARKVADAKKHESESFLASAALRDIHIYIFSETRVFSVIQHCIVVIPVVF